MSTTTSTMSTTAIHAPLAKLNTAVMSKTAPAATIATT